MTVVTAVQFVLRKLECPSHHCNFSEATYPKTTFDIGSTV